MAQAHHQSGYQFASYRLVRKQQTERKQRIAVTLALAALGMMAIGVGVFLSSDDTPEREEAMDRALMVHP